MCWLCTQRRLQLNGDNGAVWRMPLSHRIRRDAIVIALADRDGDRCWYCGCRFDGREGGGSRNLTIDHVEPAAGGGGWSLENLRLCCGTCNRRKGQLGADVYEGSDQLARRRRQMYLEELQTLGVMLPKPSLATEAPER